MQYIGKLKAVAKQQTLNDDEVGYPEYLNLSSKILTTVLLR